MFYNLIIVLLSLLLIASCSSDSSSGAKKKAALNLEVLSTASATLPPELNAGKTKATEAYGQVEVSNLSGLKYYITDISICKSMAINGTGYSGQSGCISVFSQERAYDYDTFIADGAAQETEKFIDLMNAADLAKLTKTTYLTREHVGDYYYGKVDHYRPVKVTASVKLNDDTTVYTKNGTSEWISGSGINATYVTKVDDITEGPAEESIVVLPNGGAWFKFEKPFTLTSADVENETTFQMKLAFNPEGVIKAYNQTSGNQVIQDDISNFGIVVPLMPFTPVIYRASETAKKESYLFSYTGTNTSVFNSFDFRLELYTVDEDTSNSIYAADTLQLLLRDYDDTNTDVTQVYRPFSVIASGDATPVYSFVNWLNENFITGFTRGSNAGETGTATFHVDTDTSITMDVLLRSIETIEADSTIDTISVADLGGRWIGPCTSTDSGSRKDIYDFDGGRLLQTSIYYSDAGCGTETEYLVQDYNIELIDKVTTEDDQEVKHINFTYNAMSLEPKTADRVNELNTGTYCDYTDWVIDEAKELLGQDNCNDLSVNDVVYDIYMVSGTEFYLGDVSATTAENRPIALGGTAKASYTGEIPAN